jgi:hypothetical protein
VSEIMRYARSLSEAFRDEMAYCIEGPRGERLGYYTRRMTIIQRVTGLIWRWFK